MAAPIGDYFGALALVCLTAFSACLAADRFRVPRSTALVGAGFLIGPGALKLLPADPGTAPALLAAHLLVFIAGSRLVRPGVATLRKLPGMAAPAIIIPFIAGVSATFWFPGVAAETAVAAGALFAVLWSGYPGDAAPAGPGGGESLARVASHIAGASGFAILAALAIALGEAPVQRVFIAIVPARTAVPPVLVRIAASLCCAALVLFLFPRMARAPFRGTGTHALPETAAIIGAGALSAWILGEAGAGTLIGAYLGGIALGPQVREPSRLGEILHGAQRRFVSPVLLCWMGALAGIPFENERFSMISALAFVAGLLLASGSSSAGSGNGCIRRNGAPDCPASTPQGFRQRS